MRSKLFVPAVRRELFEKALHSGADAICFDLEDAVSYDRKDEARGLLASFLSKREPSPAPLLLVRSNPVSSEQFSLDIAAITWPALVAIALPKVESADAVQSAASRIAELEVLRNIVAPIGILPTIESPRGLRLAAEIASSSPRVIGLQIGFADLLEPLGIPSENTPARNQIRLLIRLAAAEAGIDCYDSAYPSYKDAAGYEMELEAARSLGFSGSSCIHPTQIAAANLAFTPSAESIARARRVVVAARQAQQRGDAVVAVDGKMIDPPFVVYAERLLARASELT
jgi:citrate lyase subunit beta/citryl-CoA lyase